MQITNSSHDARFIPAIGRKLDPGESVEVDDVTGSQYEGNPYITLTTAPEPPIKQAATPLIVTPVNIAPVSPLEGTQVAEITS